MILNSHTLVNIDWIWQKYAYPRFLSGTGNLAWEVHFCSKTEGRHISPYSANNLFITSLTIQFTFCKLSCCNLKYLNCSNCHGLWLIPLEKAGERFLSDQNKSKHCGKTTSVYWYQMTINGDCQCCPRDLWRVVWTVFHRLRHWYLFGTIQYY